LVVAIDPGVNGGIALVGDGVPATMKMPQGEEEVWVVLRELGQQYPHARYYIEVVSGWAGANRTAAPGGAMFNFGMGYGMLRMAVLAATGNQAVKVRPQTWQAGLGVEPRRCRRRGRKKQWLETQPEFKRRLKELAVELFPEVKVTLGNCDALLIAAWALRCGSMVPGNG
jgi:hypothetical protein